MTSFITIDSKVDQTLAAALLASNFAGTVLAGTPETENEYASGVVVSADQSSFESFDLGEADQVATDGEIKIRRYDLDGVTVFVETSPYQEHLFIYPFGTSIKTVLLDGDCGDLSWPEYLASWGFDGTPGAADESATDVRIWVEPNFYVGTLGAPIGHYAYDAESASRDPLVFDTVADAQDWIDVAESGTYFLSNGEAGRPAYTICE